MTELNDSKFMLFVAPRKMGKKAKGGATNSSSVSQSHQSGASQQPGHLNLGRTGRGLES